MKIFQKGQIWRGKSGWTSVKWGWRLSGAPCRLIKFIPLAEFEKFNSSAHCAHSSFGGNINLVTCQTASSPFFASRS